MPLSLRVLRDNCPLYRLRPLLRIACAVYRLRFALRQGTFRWFGWADAAILNSRYLCMFPVPMPRGRPLPVVEVP